MRLWSLHPKYLDPRGLVALWREALLARAVLQGQTRGYRNHPQLQRFRAHASPLTAIDAYLVAVHAESLSRGYAFDVRKIEPSSRSTGMAVSSGQIDYEWRHLLDKLAVRSPEWHQRWSSEVSPQCHPLFRVQTGEVESWERTLERQAR
ncbi:MAG TPA: pyrimidine dimer DNA glycosylase/endonuclease V [Accumulibacter sp.]|nr:pyrimidine dimer DNA glycosylase/endonuclease V [Accumulibacter sp.]HMW17219.1 pyrimidine dimer DNA glycosylase/endonuclease V [Accumulibacter sp.]HMX23667.1 pyrimidine dimer DNA glycosylase/endonuclease V [Accumulibacter sp.]HMY05951.1 pyrimidine dimer DNA glycosylase/endonuclease V [Accumulibacter sp.]HND78938.1 pyrimidine dimer DNA glycosylase/endonuclease V [Accumulibacter sp.]